MQQYIDQGVDGIAVTLAKPDALRDVLAQAEEAGIPVVTLNAGENEFEDLGAFAHFGSDEQLAGQTAGERLKDVCADVSAATGLSKKALYDAALAAQKP